MDFTGRFFTFPEFVKYVVTDESLSCWNDPNLIIRRAEALWGVSCFDLKALQRAVNEAMASDPGLSEKRIWAIDPMRSKHSFLDVADYVYRKGWGGISIEGTMAVAKAIWINSYLPKDDD